MKTEEKIDWGAMCICGHKRAMHLGDEFCTDCILERKDCQKCILCRIGDNIPPLSRFQKLSIKYPVFGWLYTKIYWREFEWMRNE